MKDWKEELSYRFDHANYLDCFTTRDITEFVDKLLHQQKEDLIKKLEGEKYNQGTFDPAMGGFDEGIDRAIQIIRGE